MMMHGAARAAQEARYRSGASAASIQARRSARSAPGLQRRGELVEIAVVGRRARIAEDPAEASARRPPRAPATTPASADRAGRGIASTAGRSRAARVSARPPYSAMVLRPRAATIGPRRLLRPAGQPRLLHPHLPLGHASRSTSLGVPAAAVGHRARERPDLRQHRGGRHDRVELGERAAHRRARSPSSTTVPVGDRPAARSGTHTRTPGTTSSTARRDRVVEEAVELRQRRVEEHARDRPGTRHPDAPAQSPAARRRSAARSVRSQVKSGSSRPKCP